MLIFQESKDITIIDTIKPILEEDYFWVLDLEQKDFMITEANVFEATTSPAIKLLIDGFEFLVPVDWNILIMDPETSQLDICDVAATLGKRHFAFSFGFDSSMAQPLSIEGTDYVSEHTTFSPALNKNHMLCHPIDQTRWVNLSPVDSYNKHFRSGILTGDLI